MDLGKVDLQEEMERRAEELYTPNWFSVELKTGVGGEGRGGGGEGSGKCIVSVDSGGCLAHIPCVCVHACVCVYVRVLQGGCMALTIITVQLRMIGKERSRDRKSPCESKY